MRIFLDMDCVLADFVSGAARIHGINPADYYTFARPGEYGMEHVVARLKGWPPSRTGADGTVSFTGRFWESINATPGFWAGLDPLPWASDLFQLCAERAGATEATAVGWGGLYVVTSPSRCPECVREKEDWLARHFGLPPDRMIPTPHKELMAVYTEGGAYPLFRSATLIDDYDRNVDRFTAAGGVGVLFPALHNRLHALAADPMPTVRAALGEVY